MGPMNVRRILVGGVVGGIAAFIVDGILNGILFHGIWDAQVAAGQGKAATTATMIPELIVVVLLALLGTYTYALARPRLGGSARSALRVSAVIGLLIGLASGGGALIWSTLPAAAGWALGVSGLVVPAVGTFVGAWIYKE